MERYKKNLFSRTAWLGAITLGAFLVDPWLSLLVIPTTLAIWTIRDIQIQKFYLGFKSGSARNYRKCTQAEVQDFLAGVEASKTFLNQFRCSKSYYAGLLAEEIHDQELIEMVKSKVSVKG